MNSSTSGMPPWKIKYPLYESRSVISPAIGVSIRVNLFRQSHKVNHRPLFSPNLSHHATGPGRNSVSFTTRRRTTPATTQRTIGWRAIARPTSPNWWSPITEAASGRRHRNHLIFLFIYNCYFAYGVENAFFVPFPRILRCCFYCFCPHYGYPVFIFRKPANFVF